jgi:hypothetical protein
MVHVLSDAELALLERLKPGVFINGLVTVSEKKGHGGTVDEIRLDYVNGDRDARSTFYKNCRTLEELLTKCVEEGEAVATGGRA